MLSVRERKTAWSLAEHAGEATPDGMQRLFTTGRWDADGVRDDVRGYVAAALGDPDGVLIGDDTGFEKGGCRSAGVQRQYTGTAGKIMNCQLGVFLAYASPKRRALVDRELYLPRSWTVDGQRLVAAGVRSELGSGRNRRQPPHPSWPRPGMWGQCADQSAARHSLALRGSVARDWASGCHRPGR